ncbi:MAG: PKD domain-containing protein, partial [Anaerolineales bacterium]|nr:PKD domain-containing protein [Anaerolineales bacterium]
FIENGYVNMIGAFLEPEDAYTLVVQGETGYTDYVLSKSHLAEQISGVGIWHINADEPQALDYRMSNQTGLYQPDQYRSSDHDPVLIGLDLTSITAEFSSNSPVTIGGTSIFSNESGGTDPLTYTWDFGDGTPLSNATNPQHTYAAVGTYTVSLAVTDVWGGTAVYSDIHTILPAMSYLPMVQFNYNGY